MLEVTAGKWGRFSLHGDLLATFDTGANRSRAVIHNAHSGATLLSFGTEPSTAGSAAFSPDFTQLAISNGRILEIVDLRRNDVLFRSDEVRVIKALSWSPDGRVLAVAGSGDTATTASFFVASIHLFEPAKRQRVMTLRHGASNGQATAVAWSPDGRRLAAGDQNGLAEVWDLPTANKTLSAQIHVGGIAAISWTPDGTRVASGGNDSTVQVWEPTGGEQLLKLDIQGTVRQIEWSPNGHRLAAATEEGLISVWDATSGFEYAGSEAYAFEQIHDRLNHAKQLWDAGSQHAARALFGQIVSRVKPMAESIPAWAVSSLRISGESALARKDFQNAIWLLQVLTELRPDDPSSQDDLALAFTGAGQIAEATAAYRRSIQLNGDNPYVKSGCAWLLTNSADLQLRDIPKAVELARDATRLGPSDPRNWNTLGVCLYRAGDFKGALDAFHKSMELGSGGHSFDWFFLAMTHWQLGHMHEAHEWYHRAVEWMEKKGSPDEIRQRYFTALEWMERKGNPEELHRFRAEATALLGRPVNNSASADPRLEPVPLPDND